VTTPQLTLSSVCVPSADIVSREIEGDIIIVPLTAGVGDADEELYTLNETGRSIWQKLDGARTLGDVAAALAVEFDASPAELGADVLGFATELVSRRILSVKV
jgi:Coenzyme PQQ synthesis protein D (PqqD)